MNYMEQISKMLGLEPGEYFKISGMDDTFWLDGNGLHMLDDKGDYDLNALMMALLTGRSKIVYPPWKPKRGEKVWTICPDGDIVHDKFYPYGGYGCTWLMRYKLGKLYRTREEAEAHKEEEKKFWDEIRKELEG